MPNRGKKKMGPRAGREYCAKLLFQWRAIRDGRARKRRLCEERLVVFAARGPQQAWEKAMALGERAEFSHEIPRGVVYFEFVGLLGLESISTENSSGEIYSELRDMVLPAERRAALLPAKEQLGVFGGTRSKLRPW
jgi:hypothetical protein